MKHSKNNKKKKSAVLTTRKGIMLICTLAVLILVVNLISASFSWFSPGTVNGKGLDYRDTYGLRYEGLTFATHIGSEVTDAVYAASEDKTHKIGYVSYSSNPSTETVSVAAGETQHFRTIITNDSTTLSSNVSLYIGTLPACSLGVRSPSNTFRTFSEAKTDIYIARNAYVKKKVATDVNGPGILNIDWFVKNNGSSSIDIELGQIYILYN